MIRRFHHTRISNLLTFLVILTAAMAGCMHKRSAAPMQERTSNYSTESTSDRLVTREGQMELKVKNLSDSDKKIRGIVGEVKGYIENVTITEGDESVYHLRIPADSLDTAMTSIESVGKMIERRVWMEDVTDESIDLKARLDNLILLRDRIRNHLESAVQMADVLEIEKELARIQSEIDTLTSKLESLEKSIAWSRLHVTLRQKHVLGPLGYASYGIYWVFKKLFVIK